MSSPPLLHLLMQSRPLNPDFEFSRFLARIPFFLGEEEKQSLVGTIQVHLITLCDRLTNQGIIPLCSFHPCILETECALRTEISGFSTKHVLVASAEDFASLRISTSKRLARILSRFSRSLETSWKFSCFLSTFAVTYISAIDTQ